MNKIFKAIIFINLASLLIAIPFLAQAKIVPCGTTDAPKCQLCHFLILLRNIVDFAFKILTPLAILFIVFAGIVILTGAGSPRLIAKGKQTIRYAIAGIIIVLAGWVIINSVIVLLVNPSVFPVPWNAWKLECPIVKIDPEEASTTSYTVLNDADGDGEASPGDSLRYSLTYTNTSDTNLSNLTITSDYDQNHIFSITNISNNGTDDGDKITWNIDKLKSNQSITLSYDFVLASDFSDLLGKIEKNNILGKIFRFFNQKALAQAKIIYLQNIITISSNQAETETLNDPIKVTISSTRTVLGDPEDITGNPVYLAGYYESPDDPSSKWPSYNWYFNQLASNGANAIRFAFYSSANPFYTITPWNNNDCSQPNDSFYTDWLKPTINNANSKGLHVILTLYNQDWECNNKTQANRNKTYDKIISFLGLPKNKIIIEINWESDVNGDSWLQDQAKYFENKGIPTIITDENYNSNLGATNSVSSYAGRHRQWDRATSLKYFDSGKPTIWTERWFNTDNDNWMTRFQAREHIYRDALTVREPILFYYTRWSTPDESWLPTEYLKDAGHAVKLAKKIPWKNMVPQERYSRAVSNKGYWAVKDKVALLGWVNNESQIEIDITGWNGEYNYWWFNPRNGKFNYIDTISDPSQEFTVSTPGTEDWVFVLRGETVTPVISHKECINNSCVSVEGFGQDECDSNTDCQACSCDSWNDIGCGENNCSSDQIYQTRTCNPSGCDVESRCLSSASCGQPTSDYWLWGIRSCSSTELCQTYCDNDGADYCVRGMANCENGLYNLFGGCSSTRTGNEECSIREAGACIDVSCRCGNYPQGEVDCTNLPDGTHCDGPHWCCESGSCEQPHSDYWLNDVRSCELTTPCQTYCDNNNADLCVRGMVYCQDGNLYNLEGGCSSTKTGNQECLDRNAGGCISVSCRCGNWDCP